ncbi:GNAT family N-acetyltransferase [Desulfovibrio sp. OttesenSCG-928-O18]|nr:GNAT family N-acetyltransferase [Desulfovibrio sp. OttesenSCG-928-O18]
MQYKNAAAHRDHSILHEWKKAATSTNQADPFCCSPAWQLSAYEAFSPQSRLLTACSGGSVIAFAEHGVSRSAMFLAPIEAQWLFGCPLLGKNAVALLAESLGGLAKMYAPFFPKIVISGIRPGGALSRRLLQTFGGAFTCYLHSTGLQCAASLTGGLDGFLSRRSANHRGKLRKSLRRAEERGVYFERVKPASAEEARTTYARMLAVEAASWKGLGQCGMAESPAKEFYDIMVRRLAATRDARIIFARHEEKDIGFIFGGMAGKIYRGQQFSYVAEWKESSIGNLMQVEKVRWLCEEGARRYDMGPLDGPRMEYKAHWTEKAAAIQTWVLVKNGT